MRERYLLLANLILVPDWTLASTEIEVYHFLRARELSYPVVLKPDVGERGTGVVWFATGMPEQRAGGLSAFSSVEETFARGK